jgi:hypothetical protein
MLINKSFFSNRTYFIVKSAIRKQQIISAESKSTIKINSMINTNGIPSELNDMLDYATLKVCERRQKDEQPSMVRYCMHGYTCLLCCDDIVTDACNCRLKC